MANLNQCNFTGRLGQDPELRAFPDGTAVCNISIAVGKKWKDKQTGEVKEATTWPNLVFIGRTAEILKEYANKGDMIRVSAEYRSRQWQAEDGSNRYAHEFIVRELELLQGKNGDSRTNQQYQNYANQNNQPQQGGSNQAPASQPAGHAGAGIGQPQQQGGMPPGMAPPPGFDNFDDDIPFAPIGKEHLV